MLHFARVRHFLTPSVLVRPGHVYPAGLGPRGCLRTSHERVLCSTLSEMVITQPDDWHLHVRDGPQLQSVVPFSAQHFGRAVIMPNLVPPITTTEACMAYKERIISAIPAGCTFTPLMTLYLTDDTPEEEVWRAKAAGIVAFKLYPAGATTNSSSGVTDIKNVLPVLRAIAEADMLLLVHGEVTDPSVDIFDREKEFIQQVMIPAMDAVPDLRVVMEHITTKDAVDFVRSSPEGLAATITPQHLTLNRNSLFVGGLRPHHYCLPVLKRELHRRAVCEAATSGSTKFFLGTDSAPHPRHAKESSCGCAGIFSAPVALSVYADAFEKAGALDQLEAFASINGPEFYGLPRNRGSISLVQEPWNPPDSYQFGDDVVVPFCAQETLRWKVKALRA
ncbi:unnamed protein product [Ostreobium quekettii]|uniref:Dihydroorotase, mitochondrial n=1 Tax=Ostreobium quekettii TaxID=121088 RepID=A0A8S1IXD7_9CHLO|nr:unnamed protein product [Ostreobium quekettii]|eukprot:evm.model.scf_490.8 EVM.evm.TU.scf_490.8   scf_490:75662-82341(-)